MIKKMFTRMFDFEHLFTPVAVEHIQFSRGRFARIVYVFGVRVAFWATTKFQ